MRSRKPTTDAEGEADLLQMPLMSAGFFPSPFSRPPSVDTIHLAEFRSDRSEPPPNTRALSTTSSAETSPR
jgi:hypothetical protein